MSATDFDYSHLRCPMPECSAALYLQWTHRRDILKGDLTADFHSLPKPDDAYTATWQVECLNGHVILVPGDTADPDCTASCEIVCPHNVDTDELRTFRVHDLDRLRTVLDALGVKAGAR